MQYLSSTRGWRPRHSRRPRRRWRVLRKLTSSGPATAAGRATSSEGLPLSPSLRMNLSAFLHSGHLAASCLGCLMAHSLMQSKLKRVMLLSDACVRPSLLSTAVAAPPPICNRGGKSAWSQQGVNARAGLTRTCAHNLPSHCTLRYREEPRQVSVSRLCPCFVSANGWRTADFSMAMGRGGRLSPLSRQTPQSLPILPLPLPLQLLPRRLPAQAEGSNYPF